MFKSEFGLNQLISPSRSKKHLFIPCCTLSFSVMPKHSFHENFLLHFMVRTQGLSCFNISFLASGFLTWNFVMEFWLSNFFLFTVWIQTIRIIARFVIAIERRENSNSYSRYALISRF